MEELIDQAKKNGQIDADLNIDVKGSSTRE